MTEGRDRCSLTLYRVWPTGNENAWWWLLDRSEASAIKAVALLEGRDPATLAAEPHHDLPDGVVLDRHSHTHTIPGVRSRPPAPSFEALSAPRVRSLGRVSANRRNRASSLSPTVGSREQGRSMRCYFISYAVGISRA